MKDKFYCVMQNQNSRNNELHIFEVSEKTGDVSIRDSERFIIKRSFYKIKKKKYESISDRCKRLHRPKSC